MPLTIEEVYGKVLKGKAVIVDASEILPACGFIRRFAPYGRLAAARGADSIGKLVFGSTRSRRTKASDWMTANGAATDTVQQFLAYEKFYKITGATATASQPTSR